MINENSNTKSQPPAETFGLHEILSDSSLKSKIIKKGSNGGGSFGGGRKTPFSFNE